MKIINNSYGLIFNILLTALVLVLISACAPTPAPAPAPAPAPIKDSREVEKIGLNLLKIKNGTRWRT